MKEEDQQQLIFNLNSGKERNIERPKQSILDDLVDALFIDDFNQIMDKYTNTELDFQTIVLFIKIYMMAYKVTQNEEPNIRKKSIKELIHYAMKESNTRSEIIRSFNNNTIIKTFFDQIKKKLA